jgi:hypothetical protein
MILEPGRPRTMLFSTILRNVRRNERISDDAGRYPFRMVQMNCAIPYRGTMAQL